jgi:fibronectin-binding autotransporter adhesin
MQDLFRWRFCVTAGALVTVILFGAFVEAGPLTWGVNGAGGSGNWDTTTANWFNGSQNVAWPSGGDAVFGGASGGTVNSFTFGPVVSSMTFNTPGYVIQNGWVQSGTSGLTVTTNVDATISSLLSNSSSVGNSLVKNGSAALVLGGTNFLSAVQVNQGEVRVTGSGDLFFSNVTLANQPGVAVTLGQSSSSVSMGGLAGGGTSGGIVRPDSQARTVTLDIFGGSTFAGKLQDNGSGTLAVDMFAGSGTQTLTNANTYSGLTSIFSGTLAFAGNGSAVNSQVWIFGGTLLLDNSDTVVANRISNSVSLALNGGAIQLKGNSTTNVEETAGTVSLSGASNITVTQPGSAAAQLTFSGLQRNGHATLNVSGPGVKFGGLSNDSTGILPPYITAGNEWATVGADSHITAFSGYTTNINAGSPSDHVKLTASGTTALAAETTRTSLNLQNSASVGQTLDLAGHNLALTSGGILSSGAGASTIRNGTLSTQAQELIVTANNNLTINSSIIDGGSATALVKNGTGILTLGGTNTYTVPTAIMQGTLVVASDANLGLASTIELGGGTLRAGGSFSSTKGFTSGGSIDTAGFDVTFSGTDAGFLTKAGLGTLTLTNPSTGNTLITAGVLNLPHATSGTVQLFGGTLQAAGTLSWLDSSSASGIPILDLGGTAAATLTTGNFHPSPFGTLRIDFGIGSHSSDFWAISSPISPFPSNAGAFQFEFQNLGGVTTGVDYPLMSFSTFFSAPSPNIFAFAPDMAAAGWAGTYKTTTTGVSVRFSSVPEPSATAMLLIQGAVLALAARRRLHIRKRTPEIRVCVDPTPHR